SLMYDLAAERSGVPDFGLRVAEKRKLSNLGPIALVMREQPTLRKALAQLARYIWLQNDAYSVRLEEAGDVAMMRIGAPAWIARQGAELSLGVAMTVMRELLGAAWHPQEVWLPHAAPAKLDVHRRVFGVIPRFQQDFAALVFDRADLERPIGRADPALARHMVRYLEQIAEGRGSSFADKVREIILMLMPNGDCTVERVAQRMGMDRRTLHRRLAAEGLTFSGLLNGARREVAEALLLRSGRPFHYVAELAGFSSLSAFAHWFRRQFGCTASAYRARRASRPAWGTGEAPIHVG
ncbi:MAG TPA: AraC family transcriptional regulator, partial [Phenylobacterium sp.]|nr:AraC family transcriptional regulator [Phenylobacterium sp.]